MLYRQLEDQQVASPTILCLFDLLSCPGFSVPDIFFLVEEQSDGSIEAWAGVPASASLQVGVGPVQRQPHQITLLH